ncbi:hypothetical protein F4820DRAFT_437676 [Hypoxylon rubiginosum]|uniref:Uncharacterized protein n=1 Tax=Hypoxylon rubiginosum TaxID=110542 RepID=A0ACB9YL90_9PEZI|nr:hypothetical protein F4820DRAFT_437676 [Hypoxylon rubiginosum]
MEQGGGLWRKRYLMPSWVLQVICSLVFVIASSLALAAADYLHDNPPPGSSNNASYEGYEHNGDQAIDLVQISGGVAMALSFVTLILDMAEIVLYDHHRLSPVLLICSASVKTVVWGAYLVLTLNDPVVSVLDIVISLVLVITSAEQLVLGSMYRHRQRQDHLEDRDSSETADVEGVQDRADGGSLHRVLAHEL